MWVTTLEVVRLTTLQAMQRADRVMYVQSTGSNVARGVGGNIFTLTTFKVIRSLKGQAGSEINSAFSADELTTKRTPVF